METSGITITTVNGEKKPVKHFIRFGFDPEAIAVCNDGLYIKRGNALYEKTGESPQ
jgi:hypothetical protein